MNSLWKYKFQLIFTLFLQEIEAHFSKKSSFNLLSKKNSKSLQVLPADKQPNEAVAKMEPTFINMAFEMEKEDITTRL